MCRFEDLNFSQMSRSCYYHTSKLILCLSFFFCDVLNIADHSPCFRLCYLIACNFRLTNEINVHSLGLLPKTAFRKIFKNSLINIVSLGKYAAF